MSDNEQDISDNNETGFNEMEQPNEGGNQERGDETDNEEDEDEWRAAWVADHPNVVIDGVDYGWRLALHEIIVPEGVTRLPC